ncbi:hypothetical protein PHPALM_27644 [Phytophthora palmivora]|uniref:Uncharacterized protein n=1 Tax=Phytophthora palmivora TaxID=4796 RepID=A0A2P4XC53_9STRA|nr:hypothetical protein PHPALM_27644 [Phytophthora palmivora]
MFVASSVWLLPRSLASAKARVSLLVIWDNAEMVTQTRGDDGDSRCERICSQMQRQRAAVDTLVPPNLSTTHGDEDITTSVTNKELRNDAPSSELVGIKSRVL